MWRMVPRSSGMRLSGIFWTPSMAPPDTSTTSDHQLAAVERLGSSCGRVRLHSPKAHQRLKDVLAEPVLVALRCEVSENRLDLSLRGRLGQMDEQVRRTEVPVVLRNLVLEDQMIPEGVPR